MPRSTTRAMASETSPLLTSQNNDCFSTVDGVSTNSSVTGSGSSKASMGRGQKLFVTLCILVTELSERLTFYGLTANLVLFSSITLKLDAPWPSTINYLFTGTCYLVPVLGGWLADTYMGRFNTIYASSLLYVVGTVLMAAVSSTDLFNVNNPDTMRLVYFALSLFMIAFGTGGIKANVGPFGADQVQRDGPRAVQTFFNWFYWFINLGSLIAFTVIVGVQQKNVFSGYLITAITMFICIIVFLTGRNKYLTKPPGGSQLTEMAKIIREAIRNRKQNTGGWLDGAKSRFGGGFSEVQVDDVKALLKVIAVFILFIFYWTIYSQMQTIFLIQATYMKLQLESFTVPAASLSVFNIVAVLALIPIMDHVVYPVLSYYGIRCTPLRRIGVGMLIAAASVIVAGVVEIKRRDTWRNGEFVIQEVFGENRTASSLNVFWQMPQFILIGASEVLTSITGLEFAYSQAPKSLQGVVMGAFLVTTCLGNYVSILLVTIVRSATNSDWYPENPNQGHLEYFFFLLAGLMMVNFVVFLYISSSYKYKPSPKGTDKVVTDWDTGQPANGDPAV